MFTSAMNQVFQFFWPIQDDVDVLCSLRSAGFDEIEALSIRGHVVSRNLAPGGEVSFEQDFGRAGYEVRPRFQRDGNQLFS